MNAEKRAARVAKIEKKGKSQSEKHDTISSDLLPHANKDCTRCKFSMIIKIIADLLEVELDAKSIVFYSMTIDE